MSWSRAFGALCVLLWLAPAGARAQGEAEAEAEAPQEPDYGRNGFYLAVGGLWGRPVGWDDDIDRGFGKRAGQQAEANAAANAEAIQGIAPSSVDPVEVNLGGLGLEDGAGGFGGSVGYRVAPHAALEVEGEWVDDMSSSFSIEGTGDKGDAKVTDLWTLTANLRVYPWTGRFQPFGVVGVGVQSSKVRVSGASDALTTTATFPSGSTLENVPAEFDVTETGSTLDGAIRVGLGVDVHLTERVGAEVKTDYVVPFVDTSFFATDYLSVRVGLLFRF